MDLEGRVHSLFLTIPTTLAKPDSKFYKAGKKVLIGVQEISYLQGMAREDRLPIQRHYLLRREACARQESFVLKCRS